MRIILLGALILSTTCSSISYAENSKELKDCHSMWNEYRRLICYDEISNYQGKETETSTETNDISEEVAAKVDQWQITSEKSALTGRTDVTMRLQSDNLEPNNGGYPKPGTLWIECIDNTTSLVLQHEIFISDSHNVKYKFDDDPIQKKWMVQSTSADAVGLWSGRASIPFIKSMFGKKKMVAVLSGYSRNSELIFNITGLRRRINELATACEWKP